MSRRQAMPEGTWRQRELARLVAGGVALALVAYVLMVALLLAGGPR